MIGAALLKPLIDDLAKPPRRRSAKQLCSVMLVNERDTEIVQVPLNSNWYKLYIRHPPESIKRLRIFRTRFRLPYSRFRELVQSLKEHELFQQWNDIRHAVGRPCSPMELLLLATLRYIGRALTFDNCSEQTNISAEVHRTFAHTFFHFGATSLYDKYVRQFTATTEFMLN